MTSSRMCEGVLFVSTLPTSRVFPKYLKTKANIVQCFLVQIGCTKRDNDVLGETGSLRFVVDKNRVASPQTLLNVPTPSPIA